ncbi:MAG: glycerate kinase type-2 family protein [Beijerinckiaceae bacterium]
MTNFTAHRDLLQRMFRAAIDAAQPALCLARYLPEKPPGRVIIIGAGKAAATMAAAVEAQWQGPLDGLVITRYGHGAPTRFIEVVEAAHPVPDEAGLIAAQRILDRVQNLSADDFVLCLMSGGASALMTAPADGLSLADKQMVNRALLKSGADITEMNCVRKHLSRIKGGWLASACAPARVLTLMISDVPGDSPSVIGSGPTVPDATTLSDARAIVAKYKIDLPAAVSAALADLARETPKADDPCFANTHAVMIATPHMALEAAAAVARHSGYTPLILGDAIEGEAREVARVMAGIALAVRQHGTPIKSPCVLLSGGETTVTVRGTGRGGRNVEFMLALAVALNGAADISAMAGDTDGIDGAADNAGAIITPDTLARASALGLDAKAFLANNDGHGFFEAIGDAVATGPTLTNVNDFRALVIGQ